VNIDDGNWTPLIIILILSDDSVAINVSNVSVVKYSENIGEINISFNEDWISSIFGCINE